MGQYANFYNSRNGDRVYNADSMSEWLLPFFTTGVFNNCFQITANNDMTVTVGGGYVNIKGKTKHFEHEQTLILEKASGTLARIDNVILRRDDTERDFYIFIETGGFSKNPVAPEIVRNEAIYDLKLGEIRVDVGAIKINQKHITDTRMDPDLCGWVAATVKEIDFSQITAQFEEFIRDYSETKNGNFEEWFQSMKDQLSEDAAGKLQMEIDAERGRIDNIINDSVGESPKYIIREKLKKTYTAEKLQKFFEFEFIDGTDIRKLPEGFTPENTVISLFINEKRRNYNRPIYKQADDALLVSNGDDGCMYVSVLYITENDDDAGTGALDECEAIIVVEKASSGWNTNQNEEIADLRIGMDGKVYETAGEAVRAQFRALSEDIGDIDELVGAGV